MSDFTQEDRLLALAGVFQAARLARDIARHGVCDAGAFEASREALFNFDPETVAAVFGGERGVLRGLQALSEQLERPQQRDLEMSRYVIALLHLADRLLRDRPAMQQLHDDLTALQRRRAHIELAAGIINQQLAEIYQDRISVLGPRIMIRGEPLHLQNPENASRIRVALLAGIRAAVLWRQAGGSKWQLLLRRRGLASTARDLIDGIRG
jgi:high frequency lysogenization protein